MRSFLLLALFGFVAIAMIQARPDPEAGNEEQQPAEEPAQEPEQAQPEEGQDKNGLKNKLEELKQKAKEGKNKIGTAVDDIKAIKENIEDNIIGGLAGLLIPGGV